MGASFETLGPSGLSTKHKKHPLRSSPWLSGTRVSPRTSTLLLSPSPRTLPVTTSPQLMLRRPAPLDTTTLRPATVPTSRWFAPLLSFTAPVRGHLPSVVTTSRRLASTLDVLSRRVTTTLFFPLSPTSTLSRDLTLSTALLASPATTLLRTPLRLTQLQTRPLLLLFLSALVPLHTATAPPMPTTTRLPTTLRTPTTLVPTVFSVE